MRRFSGEHQLVVEQAAPGIPNARWIAMRLLDGDYRVQEAMLSGELAAIAASGVEPVDPVHMSISAGGDP